MYLKDNCYAVTIMYWSLWRDYLIYELLLHYLDFVFVFGVNLGKRQKQEDNNRF